MAQSSALQCPSATTGHAVDTATRKWKFLAQAEEQFFKQKSHITWLANGDQNTGFFHNTVKDRQSRNSIKRLIALDGSILTESTAIRDEAIQYFSDFLCPPADTQPTNFMDLESLITYRCSDAMADMLVSPVSAEEIKRTLDSLPSNKATGPDGFTAEFFKATWDVIGMDFIIAIQSYFHYLFMPHATNATLLALIPKTENPNTIRDFRPISCCNVIYKVISKILANRLKAILPDAIETNQSAFIKGRLLLENVILATELVKDYHKSTSSPRCALKLDISKAFDTVRWDLILNTMRAMAIPDLFILWIQGCISTAAFSVSINGETGGFFTSSRGLRQGCALSPYLFNIVNNVLSLMLNKAAATGLIAYHPLCADIALTHLSFADDIMIFTDGSEASLDSVFEVLTQFKHLSGLSINSSKSAVFFGGVISDQSRSWVVTTEIPVGSLPIRYLGLPLTTRSMTRDDYEPLLDSIRSRFNSWTTRSLSYAGRLQLIKSVIASVANFWCSVFRLPQRCLNQIERMCCSFLWSGSIVNSAKAKVSWSDVCKPKKEGGLGIRLLRDTSLVFSFSLIWRLLSSAGSLWVAWTRHYLLRHSSFWDIKSGTRGSWIWNKLLKLRSLIRPFIRYTIHDGCSTYFWLDTWLPPDPLICRLGDAATRILGIRRDALVADVVSDEGWRLRRNRRPVFQAIISAIRLLPPPHASAGPDTISWRVSDGVFKESFSSTATWNQLRTRNAVQPWHKVVWFSYSIPRYSFIVWLAILDRLSTGARMLTWGHHQPCPFCGDRSETRDHLFFACSFSFTLWSNVSTRLTGRTITPDWSVTLQSLITNRHSLTDNILLRLTFQSTVYHIWRERNNRIHGKPHSSVSAVTFSVIKCIISRLTSRISTTGHEAIALLTRWRALSD